MDSWFLIKWSIFPWLTSDVLMLAIFKSWCSYLCIYLLEHHLSLYLGRPTFEHLKLVATSLHEVLLSHLGGVFTFSSMFDPSWLLSWFSGVVPWLTSSYMLDLVIG